MQLLNKYLNEFSLYLISEKIKVEVIGQHYRLPDITQKLINNVGYQNNNDNEKVKKVLCLAISYGGRDDIVNSCKTITQLALDKKISINDINEELFNKFISLGRLEIPDPDLIIRTSGC